MKRDIVIERVYPYPVQKVWRALTDTRRLAEWLMENDFEPKVGHKFQFHTKPRLGFDGNVYCEVLEVVEPTRLSYSWQGGGLPHPTIVTWTLQEVEQGTRLQLAHTDFEGPVGLWVSAILGPGWKRILNKKLAANLASL